MTGNVISQDKKEIIRNLYLSGIGEEFIAMQLDLEILPVISVLKELESINPSKLRYYLLSYYYF